ncbi:PIR protein, putative [Plasmodium sp. gorilla clade G1]|nr:PIR protein, putative [Plasmodium sp. gorilla clade G1]
MTFSYFNILLFSILLNILINDQSNYNGPKHTRNTKPTKSHRSLCECDFNRSNYDNDPEMKSVMENFNRQSSQRFQEYEERMIKNKQKCKEQCGKDIQKIILKDKLEKELTEKFVTLDMNIATKDIPTCVCEKSLSDKTEKLCLQCGYGLGGGVLQASGLLGGIGQVWIDAWKTAALVTAKELAKKAGALAGETTRIKELIEAVIEGLNAEFGALNMGVKELGFVFDATHNTNISSITKAVYTKFQVSCLPYGSGADPTNPICSSVPSLGVEKWYVSGNEILPEEVIRKSTESIVLDAETVADAAAEMAIDEATSVAIKTNTATVNTTYVSCQTAIITSIVAILVIVLAMVIIYLILGYRRKKKMKKKLKYIKLLKE